MKKIILSLLAFAGISIAASAQIMLTVNNNSPQYFTASLLDNTWAGTTPPMYMDLPNNQVAVRTPAMWNGSPLTSTANWRGIYLRAYPSGIYYFPVYFTTVPYAGVAMGPGVTAYNISCNVLSPTSLFVQIN